MTRVAIAVVGLLLLATRAGAQLPVGDIAGAVTDATGGAVADARVSIVNRETGRARSVTTSGEGRFISVALVPGFYQVTVEADRFGRVERLVVVEVGTTSTVDVTLEVGNLHENVTVNGSEPLLRRHHHQVGGIVTRDQIDRLPLNGRSFLELAKVEPGVVPVRLADGRMFASSLGGGLQTIPRIGATRVTADGGNISTPGTVGVLLQVSADAVEAFRMTTAGFDTGTSLTTNGAINIVTRSGTNTFTGGGFYFNRNHHLAAYPALRRDAVNPDPSFARHQFGASGGGPLRKGRAFFFGNFERTDQVGVISVQLQDEFAPLGGIFSTPYAGNLFAARADVQLDRGHTMFARHTEDRNKTFATAASSGLPSSWSRRANTTRQTIAGLTAVLSPRVVNDLRVSYFTNDIAITSATAEDCGDCFGLGSHRTTVAGVAGLIFGGMGPSSLGSGGRFQLTDTLSAQQGSHTLQLGFDWERVRTTATSFSGQPVALTVFPPGRARRDVPDLPLPNSFTTPEDIWALPLSALTVSAGSGTVLWEGFRPERRSNSYRLHFNDTWHGTPRFTLNAGLGWSYEPNALSHDLTKPLLLTPILGLDGLRPPKRQTRNFSPAAGFAWTVTRDGRTVVRAGIGRYFDPAGSTNAFNLFIEREYLSPLGTATLTQPAVTYQRPTSVTAADQLANLSAILEPLRRSLNPDNRDLSLRNLDRTKSGSNLQDPHNSTPYAVHANLGVQREIAYGLVFTADVVWKRFVHTFINGIDYNRWNSTPIIPPCVGEQANDASARCSTEAMYFDTTIGRARYAGLLLRAEKRFSHGTQLLASYALGSFVGSNGTGTGTTEAAGGRVFGFNNDDWFENYGPLPTDQRHILALSGMVELPLELQLAVNVSAYSAPPFAPYVRDMDFNGDGTVNDLLPGTSINQFGRGRGKDDLARLVDEYNRRIADRKTPGPNGQTAPTLRLPDVYSFYDSFFTQDLRLTRRFDLGTGGRRAEVFVDVFNVLNTPNLIGFGSDLTARNTFGQPNNRFSQVFGSGGPRAVQIGGRLMF
jgi:hypothetical protein